MNPLFLFGMGRKIGPVKRKSGDRPVKFGVTAEKNSEMCIH